MPAAGPTQHERARATWAQRGLVISRLILVGVPPLAICGRLFLHGWAGHPQTTEGEPLALSYLLVEMLAMLWGLLLPCTLLPFAPASTARITGGTITADTILGRRSLPLEGAHQSLWFLPGRGNSMTVWSLHHGHRWLLLARTDRADTSQPILLSTRDEVAAWTKGILTLAASTGCAFGCFALMLLLAGVH